MDLFGGIVIESQQATAPARRILVIRNPVAGKSRKPFLAQVLSGMQALGAAVDIYNTTEAGDGTRYLKELKADYDLVVAAGGDGTTNEVVNGLVGKSTPVGLLPCGTANVLAAELGYPKKADELASLLVHGDTRPVYLGQLNGKRFSMMVGIGYDARVVNHVNLALKARIGKGAYVWSMLKEIATYGDQSYRFAIDGQEYEGASAIITNGRLYGGDFVLSHTASVHTPELQVFIFTRKSRWALLGYLLALPLKRMESLHSILLVNGREITVTSTEPDVLQADGDPAGLLPATIRVETSPVAVIAP